MSQDSQQPIRQSERIRSACYRRRTTWSLPEIVSVGFLFLCSAIVVLMCIFFLKGVPPASHIGEHSHRDENV